MPNYLLFQAANKQQVAECRYFLLKYLALYNLKPPAATTAVVYTPAPVAFENFANFFARFEMPEISGGPVSKTSLLHQFLQQHSGPVLYCDSATYPLQPIEPVFTAIEKGAVYLHSPHRFSEGDLAKAFRRSVEVRDKTTIATAAPPLTNISVWHTAVVGLSDRHKDVLAKLMPEETGGPTSLTADYHYTKAFESSTIKSAANYIFEYSHLPEFGQLLETFFKKNEEESIANQVKLVHHLDAATIQQQKEEYLQQPLLKKWLQRIAGKRWTIKQYESRF